MSNPLNAAAAALFAAIIAAPVAAQAPPPAGAPAGTPTASGGWTHGGWQAGDWNGAGAQPHGAMVAEHRDWHAHEGYRDFRRGHRLPKAWLTPAYEVHDWGRYRLQPPGPGMRWMRYGDDAVLVDGYGSVVDVRDGFGWGQGAGWQGGGYAGGSSHSWSYGTPGYAYSVPGPVPAPPGAYGYGASYAYGGQTYSVAPGTTVVVQPGMVTTVTTSTSEETVYRAARVRAPVVVRHRRVVHRRRPIHRRHVVRKPSCVCGS